MHIPTWRLALTGGAIVILRLSAEQAVTVEDDLAECLADSEVVKRQEFGDLHVFTVGIRGK